jgi:hypothetical protein
LNARLKLLYRLCGLIFLSRKTYTEIRFLPFQLNQFTISFEIESMSYLASVLGDKLFGAIANICLPHFLMILQPWDTLQEMQEMKALKCVVFTGHPIHKAGKEALMKTVHDVNGLEDLEIVFDSSE